MTFTPQRACRFPGCPALVPAGQGGWCPSHQRHRAADRRVRDQHRGSAADRGYDADWQRARLGFLGRWPLCLGALIPDMLHWSRAAAEEFHRLREIQREAGRLTGYTPEVLAFLAESPIYRLEPWDVTRGAVIVDHIIPHKGDHELMWSEWNWQPLTKRAHDRKTATEQAGSRENAGAQIL